MGGARRDGMGWCGVDGRGRVQRVGWALGVGDGGEGMREKGFRQGWLGRGGRKVKGPRRTSLCAGAACAVAASRWCLFG